MPLVIALVALGPACSSEPDTAPRSPSPFFTSGSSGASDITGGAGLSGGTGPTGTGPPPTSTGGVGALPTASPGAGTGNLTRGTLTFRVSGDLRASETLRTMISTVYAPPPGGMALVWTAGGTDPATVGFGGLSFVGTRPTDPTLTLTLTAPSRDAGFETFTSFDRECDVTIGTATPTAIRGSFRCDDLASSSGVVIDATGTFSASG